MLHWNRCCIQQSIGACRSLPGSRRLRPYTRGGCCLPNGFLRCVPTKLQALVRESHIAHIRAVSKALDTASVHPHVCSNDVAPTEPHRISYTSSPAPHWQCHQQAAPNISYLQRKGRETGTFIRILYGHKTKELKRKTGIERHKAGTDVYLDPFLA